MVGQAIEQRAGEAVVAECGGPLVEGQVRGDDRGAAFVALADQFEQQLGAGARQRHEPQPVDDRQRVAGPPIRSAKLRASGDARGEARGRRLASAACWRRLLRRSGRDVACTSCATCWHKPATAAAGSSPPPSPSAPPWQPAAMGWTTVFAPNDAEAASQPFGASWLRGPRRSAERPLGL